MIKKILLSTILTCVILQAGPHSPDFGRRNYHSSRNFAASIPLHFKTPENEELASKVIQKRRNSFQQARLKRKAQRLAKKQAHKENAIAHAIDGVTAVIENNGLIKQDSH